MLNIIKTILKGSIKNLIGRELTGSERFLLTSMFIKVDKIATLLTASNVHPKLIDPHYDFIRLTSDVNANIELFKKLREMFPNFDAAMPASWLGLAGCGQVQMGTKMRITKWVEPSPNKYALDVNNIENFDMESIKLPEMKGYLATQVNLCVEIQDKFPEMNSPPIIVGSFDLGVLLRGEKLFEDFMIYRDYVTTKNKQLKEKISKRASVFPKIMDFTTKASIELGNIYKSQGATMLGMVIVNQYANPPIMAPSDFFTYIYPYVEEVWKNFKKYRPTAGYMPPSPSVAREISNYPALSGIACFNNYMFPQDEIGLTSKSFDEEMVVISREIKNPYQYLISGKFLRDGNKKEIESKVKEICELAMKNDVPLSIGIAAVPLGTDLSKINLILDLVDQYGVYKS